MTPSFPIQKARNNLAIVSVILVLVSVLTAMLFHFFLYLYPASLDNTVFTIFISTPVVIGIIGIILGIISLRRIMTYNIFGKGKAITGIVLGSVILVCLVTFLFLLFSKI